MRQNGLAPWGRWWGLGLGLSLICASFAWGGEFVVYDVFEGARIEPDKWFGSETTRPSSTLEASRFVADGKLHLSTVGYGGQGANTGRHTGSFGLGVRSSRPITAMQAEMTVMSAMAETCPDNSQSSQGRAQLVSFFFNHGGSGKGGDLSGDVVAVLEKVADSRDGNFIRAVALRCTSWSCGQGELIKSLLFKHSWTLSEADVLRIEWEPSNTQFVFTVNPGAATEEIRRIAYDKTMGRLKPPEQQRQRVRVRHHGANCKAGRRGVLINVAVDDVQLRFLDAKTTAALSTPASAPLAGGEPSTSSLPDGRDGDWEWK